MIEWLDCKRIAERINNSSYNALCGKTATLAVIGYDGDLDDKRYIKGLERDGEALGVRVTIAPVINPDSVLLIGDYRLARDKTYLDVDGVSEYTPWGRAVTRAVEIALDEFCGNRRYNIVVIGRGAVGTQIAQAMLRLDHTVTICHSYTDKSQLKRAIASADVCITAARGTFSIDLIDHSMTVIDASYSFKPKAGEENSAEPYIRMTPAKDGVGAITRAVLLSRVADNVSRRKR